METPRVVAGGAIAEVALNAGGVVVHKAARPMTVAFDFDIGLPGVTALDMDRARGSEISFIFIRQSAMRVPVIEAHGAMHGVVVAVSVEIWIAVVQLRIVVVQNPGFVVIGHPVEYRSIHGL